MRSSIVAAALVAGVAAQTGQTGAVSLTSFAPAGPAPAAGAVNPPGSAAAGGNIAFAGLPSKASPTAAAQLSTKGIPVGGSGGIADSDVLCAQGIRSACGLPNIASIYNPNPNMRYQTQASDQAIASIVSTGRYDQFGNRVVTPGTPAWNQGTVDIPFWTAGGLVNQGGVYTVGNQDWTRTPVASQTNYVTTNPAAPNAFTPSASNRFLPQSNAFQFANAFPGLTTAPNALTSAGLGYSTNLAPGMTAQQGVASWATGLNGNAWNLPATNFGVPATTFGVPATTFGVPAASSWSVPAATWGNAGFTWGSPVLNSWNTGVVGNTWGRPMGAPGTAWTNAWTQNQWTGVAPAAGVAPQNTQ